MLKVTTRTDMHVDSSDSQTVPICFEKAVFDLFVPAAMFGLGSAS